MTRLWGLGEMVKVLQIRLKFPCGLRILVWAGFGDKEKDVEAQVIFLKENDQELQ